MRLGQASEGDVVQNAANHSFYRFARPERGRARIRPLELFPNGRLIPKSADTLVDAGLEVRPIGPWAEGMLAEGRPARPRERYEAELRTLSSEIGVLEAAYDALPVNGTGRQSRGSWANKVKNCRARIAAIEAGLCEVEGEPEAPAAPEHSGSALRARDVVMLPSGAPGLILAVTRQTGEPLARVRTAAPRRLPGSIGGCLEIPGVPLAALRPWSDSRLCTL